MIKKKKSQGLIEIILVLAIFSLISFSMMSMVLGSNSALLQGGQQTEAESLARLGIEAVRSVRDRAWNELMSDYVEITEIGGHWNITEDTAEDGQDFGIYNRLIMIEDVCRDSSDEVVDCPGDYLDHNSKKVTVIVSWETLIGATNQVTQTCFLTNWGSKDWVQTDWSAGSGQVVWGDEDKYLSDDGNVDVSIGGQVQLVAGLTGKDKWVFHGGSLFVDTTDDDFDDGSHNNTIVTGSGDDGSVVLEIEESVWVEHKDSGLHWSMVHDISALSDTDAWAVGDLGKIYHYNGTDWNQFQDIGFESLLTIEMLSENNGWAAGTGGKIFHYNGSSWSQFQDTGSTIWVSMSMVSDNDGWLIGNEGKVYHFDGISWTQFVDTGNEDWGDVFMISSTEGWMVRNEGKIYHYDGVSWNEQIDTGYNYWLAVHMVSSTDGWVVGSGGEIYHYNGTTWTPVSSPTSFTLFDIEMISSDNGWAVGAWGKILHYDGVNWSEYDDTGWQFWSALEFTPDGTGFVMGTFGEVYEYGDFYPAGGGTFYSRVFDGGATDTTWDIIWWTENILADSSLTIATRSGNSSTPDGSWSSFSSELSHEDGEYVTSPDRRYFQYRVTMNPGDNRTVSPQLDDVTIIYNQATTENLNGVHGSSDYDVWAVGENGAIIHYDGNSWTSEASPLTTDLEDVYLLGDSDGWAVGDEGKIIHYNGSVWADNSDTGDQRWRSVAFYDEDNGFTVGTDGNIAHYDGDSWNVVTSPTTQHLYSVFVLEEDDVWVAGNNGVILHYNGTIWSINQDTGDTDWRSIFMLNDSDGWAVGTDGKIFKYNGSIWSEYEDIGTQAFYANYHQGNYGWAMGEAGIIEYYDDGTWVSKDSPTTFGLNDIYMSYPHLGWVVGDNGTVLRFNQGLDYVLFGELISSAYDTGSDSTHYGTINWDEQIPNDNVEIKVQIRTASTQAGLASAQWSGPDGKNGDETDYFTQSQGELIHTNHNGDRWVQYKVELLSDGMITPVLEEMRINFK